MTCTARAASEAGIVVCELEEGHEGPHIRTLGASPEQRLIWPTIEPSPTPMEIIANAFACLLEMETGMGVDSWSREEMERVVVALEAMHRRVAAERLRKNWALHNRTERTGGL